MKNTQPIEIFAKDYVQNNYKIEKIELCFDLHETKTTVESKMQVCLQGELGSDLQLNGEEIELLSIKLNGVDLSEGSYSLENDILTIKEIKEKNFNLEIVNSLNPKENKALDGLYQSGQLFCTQNEPEGFRRITFYIDRPDNMAIFTTKIIGDKKLYPQLLSNGNLIEKGDLEDGKHFAIWNDPYPKPSYLFALVAGDLGMISDSYKTSEGRDVRLEIYCDKGNEDRCHFAMESLKNSMKWDEDRYGLAYDLDIYMIVAVDAFNMGAMENKGLNIFNTSLVLAKPETATDSNFFNIESVVGHEYFHNWTGNRVTCRDWFQLTLKEGLTVYRDQEFSADLNSRELCRISDVEMLKAYQFKEDAGPMAHPIKPASYMEINNFYTSTVYNKGAEIIRMIESFVGIDGFRKGMDKYFELNDGKAVTTEDFVHAMSVANNDYDFNQFKNWYAQAGTPDLSIESVFNESDSELVLTIKQSTRDTKETKEKMPFHLPLFLNLYSQKGERFSLNLKDNKDRLENGFLHIKNNEEEFVFTGIKEKPVVSLNLGFKAPVNIKYDYSQEDLINLAVFESDGYVKNEAIQSLFKQYFLKSYNQNEFYPLSKEVFKSLRSILSNENISDSFKSILIDFPSKSSLEACFEKIDFRKIHNLRNEYRKQIALELEAELTSIFKEKFNTNEYAYNLNEVGRRSLLASVTNYLSCTPNKEFEAELFARYNSCNNMTEKSSYLFCLLDMESEYAQTANEEFYKKWQDEPLVLQKWLTMNAAVSSDATVERVEELSNVKNFDFAVPNYVRSVFGVFSGNTFAFHRPDFAGYELMKKTILKVDKINPQMASRLSYSFSMVKKFQSKNKEYVVKVLKELHQHDGLSKNAYEVVDSILKDLS